MNKFNAIPLYKDMLWCNTPEQQHNVGYFDDCFSIEEHQVLLPSVCIQTDVSIEKELLSNSCSENTNILLVFFGCFAPFHEGHLNAIYLSRKQFSERGFNVLGCVLYQSHDSYILTKKHITLDNINDFTQLNIPYLKTHEIYVDSFTKTLKGELNFPYLLMRSLKYINKIKNAKLGVIVGEDNNGFSKIKHEKIEFVVISRSDSVANKYFNISSTKIRGYFVNV